MQRMHPHFLPRIEREEADRSRRREERLTMAEGRHGGRGGGGDGEGSDGGAVELSLRLRTSGSSAAPEEEPAAAARRRSMTIIYSGRVCAVDVTELQARAIISMAEQDTLEQQRRDHDLHSSSGSNGHQDPTALLRAAPRCHALPASPREVLSEEAAPPPPPPPLINNVGTGLSMKRSLQRFLQKRKTRAAAVASPYAGGRPAGR